MLIVNRIVVQISYDDKGMRIGASVTLSDIQSSIQATRDKLSVRALMIAGKWLLPQAAKRFL